MKLFNTSLIFLMLLALTSVNAQFQNVGTHILHTTKSVGIGTGTTSPDYQLDVNGDIRFTGNLYKGEGEIDFDNLNIWSKTATFARTPKVLVSNKYTIPHSFFYNYDLIINDPHSANASKMMLTASAYQSNQASIDFFDDEESTVDHSIVFDPGSSLFGLESYNSYMGFSGNDIAIRNQSNNGKITLKSSDITLEGDAHFANKISIGSGSHYAPLSFGQSLGDKIAFWDGATSSYGIGIQNEVLQIFANNSGRIALGEKSDGTFSEYLTIKDGRIGIGTDKPDYTFEVKGGDFNLDKTLRIRTKRAMETLWWDENGLVINPFNDFESGVSIGGRGLYVFGHLDVGIWSDNPTSQTNTYGKRLAFLGAHHNGDGLWMARYNKAAWESELRMNIGGDPNSSVDKFSIGVTKDDIWYPRFEVSSNGDVKCEDFSVELLSCTNIKTLNINVALDNAADYVFEPDYNLRSLSEVEEFIKENKHLPDVPSADEYRANGANLSEMNNLLLQKIEELTLYMIAIKKENEELRELINK